jgi:predicted DNA-binding transcriptional regulator YafY
MRASRLLRILLLLQNRKRMTSRALAVELEVTRRTVLRDIDALTEAGLPIVVHRGNQGGIELGFNYRMRLTGLASDEAEAIAIILSRPVPELDALGLAHAGARARAKMLESFPDSVRKRVELAQGWFQTRSSPAPEADSRLAALAQAIRERRIVRIQARSRSPRTIHPVALVHTEAGWSIVDQLSNETIGLCGCGDINISARSF